MPDPTVVGDALGQAQSVQQVLGIVIGVLLLVMLGMFKLWMGDRTARSTEKLEAQHVHDAALAERDRIIAAGKEKGRADLATASVDWERERAGYIERERDLVKENGTKVEQLMREMTTITLGVERALDQLGGGSASGAGRTPTT